MKRKIQNNLSQKYSRGIIAIHWITALLILALFPLGKYMSSLEPSEKMGLLKIHAIFGAVVFFLTLLRSYFFFKSKRPNDLKTGSKFNDKLAVLIHNLFYFLLIGIALAGFAVMVLGGYVDALKSGNLDLILSNTELASLKAHGLLATIMMILLVLHVVGVMKHYLLTKENTLKRIL
ncbi:cytochrome b [Flagellimonas myxillae]|uniref:cytochrome b n=1 Tax=Flagellimonas myxillae TaxID=2942214 RepID=UPI00201ED848|nr:cytochrome b/b6 domain-containing protein [Muricauda myxillae]MCL6266915.1 cytochrome b/b6 domain-containing protein [Muricauda myxillae]